MIMCTYKTVCITNRHLVFGQEETNGTEKLWNAYFMQLEEALKKRVSFVILREKDLSQSQYQTLAKKAIALSKKYQTLCVLHSFTETAMELDHPYIHLPFQRFWALEKDQKEKFLQIGVSVHSVEEAKKAQQHGASYITAGHIFQTQCKEGVPPRGLAFLKEICEEVTIPVYAIGGIHSDNAQKCIEQGAYGVCMMSDFFHPVKEKEQYEKEKTERIPG